MSFSPLFSIVIQLSALDDGSPLSDGDTLAIGRESEGGCMAEAIMYRTYFRHHGPSHFSLFIFKKYIFSNFLLLCNCSEIAPLERYVCCSDRSI